MKLLEEIFKTYFDTWLHVRTYKHKYKSFVRFMKIVKSKRTTSIKIFAYYPLTEKVDYFKILNLNHLSWIEMIEDMDKETEDELNVLFTRSFLIQHDEPIDDTF